jgi:hypothetical protein
VADSEAGFITTRRLGGDEEDLIAQVVRLADRHRQTLGFMPESVLTGAARAGNVFAALRGQQVLAYALVGLPGNKVRLTHLCADELYRGHGLPRRLVELLSSEFRDRSGIALKCRRDYGLDSFWLRLGFVPTVDVRGRSDSGDLLTCWWKDHGHDDLFTQAVGGGGKLIATLDTNVFLDLHANGSRDGAAESLAMQSSQYEEQFDLITTPQLLTELNQRTDATERLKVQHAASNYPRLSGDTDVIRVLADVIVLRAREQGIPSDPSLEADALMVAGAAEAGADLFISRDGPLVNAVGPIIEEVCDLRVLRPAEAMVFVDERVSAEAYQPAKLLGTAFTDSAVRAGENVDLIKFVSHQRGERKRDLNREFLNVATNAVYGHRRRVIRDPRGEEVALYTLKKNGQALEVSLFRATASDLYSTILLQLMQLLRREAVQAGAHLIRITDRYLSDTTASLMKRDGFRLVGDTWLLPVLARVETWADLRQTLMADPELQTFMAETEPWQEADEIPETLATRLEHEWWPLKISNPARVTYIVPIRPGWAERLLGSRPSLLERPSELGLSREAVYYRTSRRSRLHVPARLLWYESGEGATRVGAVTACARLISTHVNTPEVLHARFSHLGVYELDNVRSASSDEYASALRFSDIEILRRPVNYERLAQIAPDCQTGTLQSVTEINEQAFSAIYLEGVRGGGWSRGSTI